MSGFARVPNRAITDQELKGADLRVLAALCMHIDTKRAHDRCRVSWGTLAAELGMHRDTVRKSIGSLIERKYVKAKTVRRSDGTSGANIYIILDLPPKATGGGGLQTPTREAHRPPPGGSTDPRRRGSTGLPLIKNNIKNSIYQEGSADPDAVLVQRMQSLTRMQVGACWELLMSGGALVEIIRAGQAARTLSDSDLMQCLNKLKAVA